MDENDPFGSFGSVVAYNFINGQQELSEFMIKVDELKIPYEIYSREYSFSKKEKEFAEALQLIIDGNADVSESEESLFHKCQFCGKIFRKMFREKIYVNRKYIQKNDLSISNPPNSEIFISHRLKTLLEENSIIGYSTAKIYDIKTKQEIEGYFNLQLEIGLGEVTQPTLVEQKGEKCLQCDTYDINLRKGLLYFEKKTWSNQDICYTKEIFGTSDAYRCSANREVIISQRLHKLLTTNKIRLFSVQPIFFV